MCGRTCLTLAPEEIQCACKYKINQKSLDNTHNKNNQNEEKIKSEKDTDVKEESDNTDSNNQEYLMPEWRAEFNCGRTYTPSFNNAPTDITPVLVSACHFSDEANDKERLIVPMMWGMVPFWHKGDYRKHGLTTNNCRLEHMLNSKLYRGPFRRGQRCVIPCEGFYEWQTTKSVRPSERAAHLVFMPQIDDTVKIYDRNTWPKVDDVKLLYMAGLFDVWQDENGDKIYSYSVITFESTKIMNWMHHRMPAILETEEQINNWLNYKCVSDEQALDTLRPALQIQFLRVSNVVNNSRNKSPQCNKPLELIQSQPSTPVAPKSKIMSAWLQQRKRREEQIAKESPPSDDERENAQDTSDSDAEASPAAKRPRFRDFKKSLKTLAETTKKTEEHVVPVLNKQNSNT